MLGNVAVPSGAVYPDGLPETYADPDIQSSVRPEGSYFVKSEGYETIRPGRTEFQHNAGPGIHFTPLRFAEDIAMPNSLPVMVDVSTAPDHADIADLPGSQNLTVDGQASEQERVLIGESDRSTPVGGPVRHRGTKTLPDMGDREAHRPLSQVFHGLADPVQMFKAEYAKNPLAALAAAGVGVTLVYMVARDFDRSYRNRGGGGAGTPVRDTAAVAPAAADTSGNLAVKAADTVAAVVETAADGVDKVVDAATGS